MECHEGSLHSLKLERVHYGALVIEPTDQEKPIKASLDVDSCMIFYMQPNLVTQVKGYE